MFHVERREGCQVQPRTSFDSLLRIAFVYHVPHGTIPETPDQGDRPLLVSTLCMPPRALQCVPRETHDGGPLRLSQVFHVEL